MYVQFICSLLFVVDVFSQPFSAPQHFYPYGPDVGDETAPVIDDGGTDAIEVSTQFPFFNERHTSLYVNTNGAISFLLPLWQYTPDAFPLDGNRRLLCAFWADVDTTRNAGRAYYREAFDRDLLLRATDDVRRAFVSLTSFSATWAFVASWHKVTFFGGTAATPVNTFQIVLVTNGRHSFAIFNYGEISWTTGTASGGDAEGLGGSAAHAGFNAGDGVRFFSMPGSGQTAIVDIEQTTNVGLPGRWVFRVDDSAVTAGGCNTHGSLTLSPRFGSMLGGISIVESGPCFEEKKPLAQNVVCKFDGVVTAAEQLDATRTRCVLPMLLTSGRIPVALSVDGGLNFKYAGVFTLVAEEKRQFVKLVNRDSIELGSFTNTLQVAWPQSFFDGTHVDVDFVTFSYSGEDQSVVTDVIPIAKQAPNSGTLTFPAGLRVVSSELSDWNVGAIRLRQNSYNGTLDDTFLWSDVHLADWYLNMYFVEMARQVSGIKDLGGSVLKLAGAYLASAKYIASLKCDAWSEKERSRPLPDQGLSACPCTREQAQVDDRFAVDAACAGTLGCGDATGGASACFQVVSPGSLGGGQQCCYDGTGAILTTIDDGAGTFHKSHDAGYKRSGINKLPIIHHILDDLLPLFLCCELSKKCKEYGAARPSDDCKAYEPPTRATTNGEPHIITMDGLAYTFNGLGEFWLVRSADFSIQARATVAKNDAGDSLRATVWTAVIAKTSFSDVDVVQVQINTRTGLDIFINGVREEFEDLPTQQFNGVLVTYDEANTTVNVRFQLAVEYSFWITAIEQIMYFSIFWPQNAGRPSGLLGNANGDKEDDLQTPDGVKVNSNSTLREIHELFGVTWQTTANESMFTYEIGSSHSTFVDVTFSPQLEPLRADAATLTRVTELCGDSEQCRFDYLMTGNPSLAVASLNAVVLQEAFVTSSRKVVSCGHLAPPLHGSRNGSSPLLGSVIRLSCDDGFRLEGATRRRCTEAGTWSGGETRCIEYCGMLAAPVDGSLRGSGDAVGAVVTFTCHDGFHLLGSARRQCVTGASWDGSTTTCEARRMSAGVVAIVVAVVAVSLSTLAAVIVAVIISTRKRLRREENSVRYQYNKAVPLEDNASITSPYDWYQDNMT